MIQTVPSNKTQYDLLKVHLGFDSDCPEWQNTIWLIKRKVHLSLWFRLSRVTKHNVTYFKCILVYDSDCPM